MKILISGVLHNYEIYTTISIAKFVWDKLMSASVNRYQWCTFDYYTVIIVPFL